MFDYVNEYLRRAKEGHKPGTYNHDVVRHVRCAKGLELSIQASHRHYCDPRQDTGPWDTVEVGFPSRKLRTLSEYADSGWSVYAYVPVEKLNRIIRHAGGIVEPFVVLPSIKSKENTYATE